MSFTAPEDESGDDVRWGMYHERGDGEGVDAYVEAHLSEDYGDRNGGVAVGLHITMFGGQIVGMCTPHNYTDEVWVRRNDMAAVDFRMAELESVDVSGIQGMILDHLRR